jgi:hypothetical protein
VISTCQQSFSSATEDLFYTPGQARSWCYFGGGVVATLGTFFYSASTVGSYRRPRGDHTKPRIEGSEFAQEAWSEGSRSRPSLDPGGFSSGSRPSRTNKVRRCATSLANLSPFSQVLIKAVRRCSGSKFNSGTPPTFGVAVNRVRSVRREQDIRFFSELFGSSARTSFNS